MASPRSERSSTRRGAPCTGSARNVNGAGSQRGCRDSPCGACLCVFTAGITLSPNGISARLVVGNPFAFYLRRRFRQMLGHDAGSGSGVVGAKEIMQALASRTKHGCSDLKRQGRRQQSNLSMIQPTCKASQQHTCSIRTTNRCGPKGALILGRKKFAIAAPEATSASAPG